VSHWRLSFNSRMVHVGFAVDIVVEEHVFLQVFRFFLVSIIPTAPYAYFIHLPLALHSFSN